MPPRTVTARFTNSRDVLLAVQAALVNGLVDIFPDPAAIMISDPENWDDGVPEPQISTAFLTVAPTDSDFPDDTQVGGGQFACEELAGVAITIFSDSRLDQTGQMPAAVYDPNEGLFELKRRVLRVMVGADPVGDNALPLLSQLVPIRRGTKPRKNPQGIHFITLEFGTSHFWDLT
jgi:hypothetical protein